MKIEPIERLFGEAAIPGDKSISHRAIMLGALASGRTRVKGILDCDDCSYTIRAFKDMGIDIRRKDDILTIDGKGLKGLKRPPGPIYLGESGTSMRILTGILSGQDFEAVLTGDESLSKRPMRRIVEPLGLMGADIQALGGGYPPLVIKGSAVKPIDYKMPVSSAQVKSAILFAGLYANGVTKVHEEFKSRDHTERMMKYFGANIKVKGSSVSLKGERELKAKTLEIPGDISSASFFMVGSTILKGSKVRMNGIGINSTRAGILDILSRMGARIKILNKKNTFEPVGDILVEHSATKGVVIEEKVIPSIIDELPVLFVLAAFSKGRTVIKGARELRIKETDRINSMKNNLEKMGAKVSVDGDDVIIDGTEPLRGADFKNYGDHRTCMAMAIAALAAKGASTIDDTECVSKSFPNFFQILDGLKG